MTNKVFILGLLVGVCCGLPSKSNERILGGTIALPEEFPYMINMYYKGAFHCGGSVLTKTTILTAAHCTYETSAEDIVINAGSINLGQGVTHKVKKVIVHKNYHPSTLSNDIALLILKNPLKFTASVQPIEVGRFFIDGGRKAISTGWGMTSYPGEASPRLLYLDVITVKQQECKKLIYPYGIGADHLCVYAGRRGKGVCRGDSGGPLVMNGKVIGIASFVKQYCAKGYPDVFTRVSMFANWIDKYAQ